MNGTPLRAGLKARCVSSEAKGCWPHGPKRACANGGAGKSFRTVVRLGRADVLHIKVGAVPDFSPMSQLSTSAIGIGGALHLPLGDSMRVVNFGGSVIQLAGNRS